MTPGIGTKAVFERPQLDKLIAALRDDGYLVLGPRVADGAVVYGEVESSDALPAGWTDHSAGGSVRLSHVDGSNALFDYTLGVEGWKRFLYPPRQRLFQAERAGAGFRILRNPEQTRPMAFLGVRGCELAAIRIQDRVFSSPGFEEPGYLGRRQSAFVVAVECGRANDTCFCASSAPGSGPDVGPGYDLKLNELADDSHHVFLVEAGTERGLAVLGALTLREPTQDELDRAMAQPAEAARQQTRKLEPDAGAILYRHLESRHWDKVAARCLTCANCTMVCPTCFCTTVEDVTDLTGNKAERWRTWDSCFSIDYGHVVGGSLRAEPSSRYRQWITHKLATWEGQFGTSGCVGCGRCIAWCPVGIDITEEVHALRESEETQGPHKAEQER
jgi:formate hydrogenlyase subunit 6/NADH:ubiquinone oxidoreductase subunit I